MSQAEILKRAEEAERALRLIFSHWNEFGAGHGFEDLIARLEVRQADKKQWSDC